MNPASLHEMKHSIVRAVQDFVDIEAEELVEVNASSVGIIRPWKFCGHRYLSVDVL